MRLGDFVFGTLAVLLLAVVLRLYIGTIFFEPDLLP